MCSFNIAFPRTHKVRTLVKVKEACADVQSHRSLSSHTTVNTFVKIKRSLHIFAVLL